MGILELFLTFLGGGALASFLTFLISKKRENRTDQQTINNQLYKEIGRLSEKLEKIELEKDQKEEENLMLKEKNFKLEVQLEEIKKDYNELKNNYAELKSDYEEIKLLLIKKEK